MDAKVEQKINFRDAGSEDIDRMTELDKICFTDSWSRSDFEKELTNNKLALYLIAEDGDKLIGYAGLWCIMDEGHVTNIAIHPDYREQGIGKKLVGILLEKAKNTENIQNFTLEVRPSNQPAIKLYEGFGFREVGRRKEYYSNNKEDAAIMWLIGKE